MLKYRATFKYRLELWPPDVYIQEWMLVFKQLFTFFKAHCIIRHVQSKMLELCDRDSSVSTSWGSLNRESNLGLDMKKTVSKIWVFVDSFTLSRPRIDFLLRLPQLVETEGSRLRGSNLLECTRLIRYYRQKHLRFWTLYLPWPLWWHNYYDN